MRHSYQSLILVALFFATKAYPINFFADYLYWKPSETVDWTLTNNFSTSNQMIAYKTISFDHDSGFRVGAGSQFKQYDIRAYYTRLNTQTTAYTNGNVISIFLGGKTATPFYQSGHVNWRIDFNMFDVDLSQHFLISEKLHLIPMIGLKGGSINQTISTRFEGGTSISENLINNFTGIGPVIGVGTLFNIYQTSNTSAGFKIDFNSAFMWGKWNIRDHLTQDNSSRTINVRSGKRNIGAFMIQGFIGAQAEYKNLSIKVGYEASDWFNQYQVLDDGTGAHNNDLVFQGLTASMKATI